VQVLELELMSAKGLELVQELEQKRVQRLELELEQKLDPLG
jgi:hypothetical protein